MQLSSDNVVLMMDRRNVRTERINRSTMKTLSTSSGDGGGMEIDKRLTKVETCIEFMQTDIAEMQGDIKSINKTILKMSDSFNARILALTLVFFTSFGAMYLALDSSIEKKIGKFEKNIDDRFDKVDDKFNKVDDRFSKVDDRFDKVDDRFSKVDDRFNKVDARIDRLEDKMDQNFSLIMNEFKELREEISKK